MKAASVDRGRTNIEKSMNVNSIIYIHNSTGTSISIINRVGRIENKQVSVELITK